LAFHPGDLVGLARPPALVVRARRLVLPFPVLRATFAVVLVISHRRPPYSLLSLPERSASRPRSSGRRSLMLRWPCCCSRCWGSGGRSSRRCSPRSVSRSVILA